MNFKQIINNFDPVKLDIAAFARKISNKNSTNVEEDVH